jgi:hypothetical protein
MHREPTQSLLRLFSNSSPPNAPYLCGPGGARPRGFSVSPQSSTLRAYWYSAGRLLSIGQAQAAGGAARRSCRKPYPHSHGRARRSGSDPWSNARSTGHRWCSRRRPACALKPIPLHNHSLRRHRAREGLRSPNVARQGQEIGCILIDWRQANLSSLGVAEKRGFGFPECRRSSNHGPPGPMLALSHPGCSPSIRSARANSTCLVG